MRPGPNLKLGTLLFLFFFVASASALYAGATVVDRPEPPSEAGEDGDALPAGPVSVTLVAETLRFDKRTIAANAGQQVTVTLDNRDAGTLHNVAFYTNRSAAQTIFKGELFPGPATRQESFPAPGTPGSYFFRCDVHPDTMTGTFNVR